MLCAKQTIPVFMSSGQLRIRIPPVSHNAKLVEEVSALAHKLEKLTKVLLMIPSCVGGFPILLSEWV